MRRLLKPMVLAKLMQAAEVGEDDHVLDVGCATGYSSAVLASLARSVVALEEDAALARRAARESAGRRRANVTVVTGPLTAGWPAEAPYDVILLNGAAEIVPAGAVRPAQGRRPAGRRSWAAPPAARPCSTARSSGDVSGWPIFDAAAPLLPGFAAPPAFVF